MVATYRPDLCPDPEQAAVLYSELVNIMEQHVDLFLIETMSSVAQAEGALRGTANSNKPVWLGLTVKDDQGGLLRSGESVADCAQLIKTYGPDAVLINCSCPEAISDALDIVQTFGIPYGAYANGFTHISESFLQDKPTVDALESRHDLNPEKYTQFALDWIQQGATIVGGCCEVGPEHIRELAMQLQTLGYDID